MELNDALRIPLGVCVVWDALQDLALLRASLDNCESFIRFPHGEYALTLTVPLGPLRARYEARAHVAGQDSGPAEAERRTINFKARAEGIGALRGQIEVRLRADEGAHGSPKKERGTRIDYTIWATSSGPLAELPTRQLENALHQLADDFFAEFNAVVRAKHGQGPNRARGSTVRRQHVFLRPIALGGIARRTRDHGNALTGRTAGASQGGAQGISHGASHRESSPHAVPNWAWAAMIFVVALLLYVARWISEH